MIKFLFALTIIFLGFFVTWNFIGDLIRYKNCVPDRVNFIDTEIIEATGSTYIYRIGFVNNKKIYLDDRNIHNDTIMDVWRTNGNYNLHSYPRKSGETAGDFKVRIVLNYIKNSLLWLSIFFVLHIITRILGKTVRLEKLKPTDGPVCRSL